MNGFAALELLSSVFTVDAGWPSLPVYSVIALWRAVEVVVLRVVLFK